MCHTPVDRPEVSIKPKKNDTLSRQAEGSRGAICFMPNPRIDDAMVSLFPV